MTKLAVTGASGHLGANLVRRLLADDHDVVAIDLVRGPGLAGLDIDFRPVDVRDRPALESIYRGVDTVLHLAGRISVTGDPDGSVWSVNVDGAEASSRAALEAGVSRYVHVSSVHAQRATAPGDVIDETFPPPEPDAPAYDRSKAAGERLVATAVSKGLDAVIVRPTGIIGPVDHEPSPTGRFLSGLRTGRIRAVTAGGFDWVDGRDVADGIVAAAERGETGRAYLLSGTWASFSELSRMVNAAVGREGEARVVPLRLLRPLGAIGTPLMRRRPSLGLPTSEALRVIAEAKPVDGSLARDRLGHRSRPLPETVADVVRWQAEHLDRVED